MRSLALVLLIALLAVAINSAGETHTTLAACPSPGLANAGFEQGLECWTVEAAPDAASAVGSEGPAQFGGYQNAPGGPITVSPYRGSQMVRLGTPRNVAESQPAGANRVSQSFVPTSDSLRVAVRLFSWEPRGTDTFAVSVTKGTGTAAGTFEAFTLKRGSSTIVSCSGPSICSRTVDVGNRGQFMDSGWVVITVNGLGDEAAAGTTVKLTLAAGGAGNNSTGTWAYFDNVNSPPVASFSSLFPKVDLGGGFLEVPLEGTAIQFADASFDPDPGDTIVSWRWTVNGPAPLPSTGLIMTNQHPFFLPPDDGTYSITLEVWDQQGERGTTQADLVVVNAPPLANALDVEGLAGRDIPLVARFSDAGWLDTHTASWAGVPVSGTTLAEDNAALLASGISTATAAPLDPNCDASGAPCAPATGTFTVADMDGGTDSDDFSVTVLPDTEATRGRFEPGDDAFASAPPLTTDVASISFLQSAGDRDVREILWKGVDGLGPQPLPSGAEVLVTLRDLPADYDVVLVAVPPEQETAGFAFSGFAFSGYAFSDLPTLVNPYTAGFAFSGEDTAGYAFSAVERSAYAEAGYAFSGYAFSGYAFSGYAFSGYAFSGFAFSPFDLTGYAFSPISQTSFTGLDEASVSPSDIALSELNVGDLPQGARVVGYSANRGQGDDIVLTRIDVPGTRLYAVVVGSNGAFSQAPYTLQAEGSMPLLTAALNASSNPLDATFPDGQSAICATPRFEDVPAGSVETLHGSALADPRVLYITQRQRLQALHDLSDAEWTALLGDLTDLAGATDGKIVSLPSAGYDAWDDSPCSVEAANAVASNVRSLVLDELAAHPSIEYVVVVGDDDIVPSRRVPDETTISNERYYLISSYLAPGTPLHASVAGGYNLTDDCFVDMAPTPWQGRDLCIPDVAISRLIETPAEIGAQARAFVESGGLLDTSTEQSFVSGYDFFGDGAAAVSDALTALGAVSPLINDSWTAADLRCQLLGSGANCPAARYDISVPHAHFTHYAGLSAGGFETENYDDVLLGQEVSVIAEAGSFIGKLLYTIGCHAGFNAPDRAVTGDTTLGFDPAIDFPQAFAQARAVYLASTGFGLGDDQGIGGTERLLVIFSEELANNGGSVGDALVAAKRRYLSTLSAVSVYDEKSSINLTMYGLPMYRRTADAGAAQIASADESASQSVGLQTWTPPAAFALESTPDGQYYSLEGDAGAPPYRPLQPRFVQQPAPGEPVHGVLWLGGTFEDHSDFDPVIVRPRIEWEVDAAEPQSCYDSFWPADLFRVNTLDGPSGIEQTLVVTPGQFACESGDGVPVRGTQRLFTSLDWEEQRSSSEDFAAPAITGVDLSANPDGALTASVAALDPAVTGAESLTTGIARIVVLRISSSSGEVAVAGDVVLEQPWSTTGTFDVPVGPLAPGDRLFVQVVDGAGNVGTYSLKGVGLYFIAVDAGPDVDFKDGVPVTFEATIPGFGDLTGPVQYLWDFGDGSTASGVVEDTTLSIQHTYSLDDGAAFTARLRILDAAGGIGADTVLVSYFCRDPQDVVFDPRSNVDARKADIVGCRVTTADGRMQIALSTAGPLVDGAGAPATDKIRYVVELETPAGTQRLQYRDGQSNGAPSLAVSVAGSTITFDVATADIGWEPGQALSWFAVTQGGIEGTGAAGTLDRAPDEAAFTYP